MYRDASVFLLTTEGEFLVKNAVPMASAPVLLRTRRAAGDRRRSPPTFSSAIRPGPGAAARNSGHLVGLTDAQLNPFAGDFPGQAVEGLGGGRSHAFA